MAHTPTEFVVLSLEDVANLYKICFCGFLLSLFFVVPISDSSLTPIALLSFCGRCSEESSSDGRTQTNIEYPLRNVLFQSNPGNFIPPPFINISSSSLLSNSLF